jgi:alkanesulfonate monooxygenase SsuD/methylene tetrahydromethanopterin reductase-like flavin-dependent oxidoreductase (luciferase family)
MAVLSAVASAGDRGCNRRKSRRQQVARCTDKTTLHGSHYNVSEAMGLPKPVQQAGPPIMIGGTGEKVLLKIVAKRADM